jgi:tellurite resistance protein TerC
VIAAAATSLAETAIPQTPPWEWAVFGVVIIVALAVDLAILQKPAHARGLKEAAIWSAVWISLAVLFNIGVFNWKGAQQGMQFATAYLLELSLSVDNLFIFLVIFRFFGVEESCRPRVLFWGILGAVVLRGIMIGAGVELIQHFTWLMYIFGAVLIYTGIKLFFAKDEAYEPSKTLAYRLTRRYVPMTEKYRGALFFVHENGKRLATPLFLVLVVVETTDLVFAVDSIPACLGVSRDPFIVYTSNIFAVLGLRSFYFLLAGLMGSLRHLKPALSLVLIFIGLKMTVEEACTAGLIAEPWHSRLELSTGVSLAVVGGILALAVVASLAFPANSEKEPPMNTDERR